VQLPRAFNICALGLSDGNIAYATEHQLCSGIISLVITKTLDHLETQFLTS
jgi:hypothetical protein